MLLTQLLLGDGQLDAAENSAIRMVNLLPEKHPVPLLCKSHSALGDVYDRKGEKEKAVGHFETALRIASRLNWQDELFNIHYTLAKLFLTEDDFANANTHVEQAKSHTVDNTRNLGFAMEFQARIWYRQWRLEDARCEALCALETYEKIGAANDVGGCRRLLQRIEQATERRAISGESISCGELSGHGAPFHKC